LPLPFFCYSLTKNWLLEQMKEIMTHPLTYQLTPYILHFTIINLMPAMMVHDWNSSTQEVKAGESWVWV
jgi:hypothetical protein